MHSKSARRQPLFQQLRIFVNVIDARRIFAPGVWSLFIHHRCCATSAAGGNDEGNRKYLPLRIVLVGNGHVHRWTRWHWPLRAHDNKVTVPKKQLASRQASIGMFVVGVLVLSLSCSLSDLLVVALVLDGVGIGIGDGVRRSC